MKNFESCSVYKYNHFVINKNLKDISHEESLISPEKGGSCINWILGHLIYNKDFALETLGIERITGKQYEELYNSGTKSKPGNAIALDELIKLFNEGHEKLITALAEKDLTGEEQIGTIAGLAFHEAYHAGQIGLLRRIIGKPSVIK